MGRQLFEPDDGGIRTFAEDDGLSDVLKAEQRKFDRLSKRVGVISRALGPALSSEKNTQLKAELESLQEKRRSSYAVIEQLYRELDPNDDEGGWELFQYDNGAFVAYLERLEEESDDEEESDHAAKLG